MILFAILVIILLFLTIITVTVTGVIGSSIFVIFGDVIVFTLLIVLVVKLFNRLRRNKKG